jgi:hypothetical protein
MSTDLHLSLLNLEAGGLQPDGSYDFDGLVRAFADPPAPHLLMICECKFWHARGKTPFRTAIRQLSTLTGRHYVGELFTGPLGTAVIYDPTVLHLDAGEEPAFPDNATSPASPSTTHPTTASGHSLSTGPTTTATNASPAPDSSPDTAAPPCPPFSPVTTTPAPAAGISRNAIGRPRTTTSGPTKANGSTTAPPTGIGKRTPTRSTISSAGGPDHRTPARRRRLPRDRRTRVARQPRLRRPAHHHRQTR